MLLSFLLLLFLISLTNEQGLPPGLNIENGKFYRRQNFSGKVLFKK